MRSSHSLNTAVELVFEASNQISKDIEKIKALLRSWKKSLEINAEDFTLVRLSSSITEFVNQHPISMMLIGLLLIMCLL